GCGVCCAHTYARDPDRDVAANRLRILQRPEDLLERRGNVSVGEVSSVEHDRDPAAAACINSGSHRHSTDRRSFDMRPANGAEIVLDAPTRPAGNSAKWPNLRS